ncbi:S8 family serine peptidase [Streptomyces litchfieldiae]|uniref:S8 family serine peptidase n=1 Tax=Streptomyces litchfieldiae TaxID=3075543 RepID=A0ABU2MJ00_9ACTN|nr:S8 family serine peptidase [Streptomyces sp. DSM 44938]MDT0341353.1 S8 family serine peptidase [Streptomyces sp. DSM 44938]
MTGKRTSARTGAAVVCGVITAALTAGLTGPAGAAGDGPGERAAGGGGDTRLVPLITGDRVAVDASGEVRGLIMAEGREDVPVQVGRVGDHTEVVPQDVVPLIREGVLDRRLFDITELSRAGHRAGDGLPLIVTYAGSAARAEVRAAAGSGERLALEAINGEALTVAGDELTTIWDALTEPAGSGDRALAAAPGIETIALDAQVQGALDESVPGIGAPVAWESGYDGEGVTIAVLDSGISEDHPDLAGKVAAAEVFSEAPDTEDHRGHGTHVASIAAGTGAHADGAYTGVAPGATLLNGKVLNDNGMGSESWTIAGMQWAVDQGADIVNLSVGTQASYVDPMADALNALAAESGTLFVVSAGNEGPYPNTITTPGSAESALTVGAVDKAGALAEFSSTGGVDDAALKPDLTAPGVDIGAAAAPGSAYGENGEPVADGYVALSGTSMAAPHTAGAAALLAQRHPDWTGEQLKAALIAAAAPAAGQGALQQGAGRVDAATAIDQTVVAEPGALDFGAVAHPHTEAEPVARELTYRNLGDRDVTLDLSVTGVDPEGNPAPDGMFTLDATEVTVPAGGTATVGVTADTSGGGELYGVYSAYVTGAGDGQRVTTAGAVEREEERFDLTIEAIGRDGEPAPHWLAIATDLDLLFDAPSILYGDGAATGTLRLPPGDYLVDTTVFHGGTSHLDATGMDWLLQPHVALTEDTTLTIDAREAAEISMTVDDQRAELTDLVVNYDLQMKDGLLGWSWNWRTAGLPDGFRTAQLGPVADDWIFAYSSAAARFERDGREYHTADRRAGELYHGLEHHTGWGDLARIRVREGASTADATGVLATYSQAEFRMLFAAPERSLPRITDVYVRADAGWWTHDFYQLDDQGNDLAFLRGDRHTYTAGEAYEQTYNIGVFGPDIANGDGLFREGDWIYGWLNPFSDGGGHLGVSGYDSATTTLYRDGEEYATEDAPLDEAWFEVPPDEAEYELVTTVTRGAPVATVSTEITVSTTFTSATTPEGQYAQLPLSVVRFTPRLALDSTAPAGRTLRVPVTVQGSAAGENQESLTVAVSFDSGASWETVPVVDGAVRVGNPAAGGTVSLRAEAVDRQGNVTVQTIIDAYRTA